MQKWEYLDLPTVIQNEMILSEKFSSYFQSGILVLNTVGQDGWELVSVSDRVAYFKRPIFDPNDLPVGVHYAGDITDKIEFGVEYRDESP